MEIDLQFKKLHSYIQKGIETKVSSAKYKNIEITERISVPLYNIKNIFCNKKVKIEYHVDLIMHINTVPKNGIMTTWYEQEGYGHPYFEDLQDAIDFINDYNNNPFNKV